MLNNCVVYKVLNSVHKCTFFPVTLQVTDKMNTNKQLQASTRTTEPCPMNCTLNFDVLLTVHFSIFISVINQLDAQNFCFTISLFHASTCFEHMCSSSGGQNCIKLFNY